MRTSSGRNLMAVTIASSTNDNSVRAALRSPHRLKTEVLAGLVVALALIPEAISFSIIAGVDPRVGLFASFTMAVTIAVVGGRSGLGASSNRIWRSESATE